jgi:transcriptional regulator with XRE-family HTH domain
MKIQGNMEKFLPLTSQETSTWEQEAQQRQADSAWQPKSAAIALEILRTLRGQKLSQKDLAARIGVSPQYINKIVKGHENLSLETITRLESGLGVSLITVYVGEQRRVGRGPRFSTMPVDYYRATADVPERVAEPYAHFTSNSDQLHIPA